MGCVSPWVRGLAFSPNPSADFVVGGRGRCVGVVAQGLCLGFSCVTSESSHVWLAMRQARNGRHAIDLLARPSSGEIPGTNTDISRRR